MLIYVMIGLISVVALGVDLYIYLRVVRRHDFGKPWKIGYLVYAFLIDTGIVTALAMYRNVSQNEDTAMMRVVMWVFAIFFLNLVPKMIYAVVSLGDYPVQWARKRTSHIFGYTGTALALVAMCVMIAGMTVGRSRIRVTTVEIHFPNLPASFDGMRVVQFSDNHIGTLVHRDRFLNRFVDRINALEPDLVINSGDIVNTHAWELDRAAMDIFSRIESRYGVYSALGNHDLGIYMPDTTVVTPSMNIAELIRRQESMGWTMLVNRSVYVDNGKDTIVVSGVNFPTGMRHNGYQSTMEGLDLDATYDNIDNSKFNITISHTPQLWDMIVEKAAPDLTVAGHVHAMQMKLSIGNWSWSPAKFMYEEWSGLYERAGRYLYVNDGAGYVMYPMRIGTRPEITLYILKSGDR